MTVVEIVKTCPYCDGTICMKMFRLDDGDTVYCPYCGSVLGYAHVGLSIQYNDMYEDVEFFEKFCIYCSNLLPDNRCRLQPDRPRANYAYDGCRFEET